MELSLEKYSICGGCSGLIVYFIDYILISIVANLTGGMEFKDLHNLSLQL